MAPNRQKSKEASRGNAVCMPTHAEEGKGRDGGAGGREGKGTTKGQGWIGDGKHARRKVPAAHV